MRQNSIYKGPKAEACTTYFESCTEFVKVECEVEECQYKQTKCGLHTEDIGEPLEAPGSYLIRFVL